MKKLILLLTLTVISLGLCSCGTGYTPALSGNTVLAEYEDDGVRQLVTEKEYVTALQNEFSAEYKSINGTLPESEADMILWFGNDIDLSLNSSGEVVCILVKDEKAYITDNEKTYRSVKKIDMSVFDGLVKRNEK